MWNTPTLPACLLSQANITQSARVAEQSELQWLVMVTFPGRTTGLVTSYPSIHFLLKIVEVVETLDGFTDSLTLISFYFFAMYRKDINFYESYFISAFVVSSFFDCLLWFLCQKSFWGCFPLEISAVLREMQKKFHLTTPSIFFLHQRNQSRISPYSNKTPINYR